MTSAWPPQLRTFIQLPKAHESLLPPRFADDDVRYAEGLVRHFVEALTDPGDVVLDPFAGFGTTLVVADELGRAGWGVELDGDRVELVRGRLRHPRRLLHEDARRIGELDLPPARLCMTSPPYTSGADDADALSAYRDPHRGYAAYLDDLRAVFEQVRGLVLPAGWVVVEAANLKDEAGVTSLAWDVCRALERVLRFRGEVVVGWEPTYGYGYDHSYCLVFTV